MFAEMLRLCAIGEVPAGESRRVDVEGHAPFCVHNVAGRFFVTEDICTHGEASLGDEGELDGFVITCTWHMGQFDVRTGEALTTPCSIAIKTFAVAIVDEHICIDTGPSRASDE